MANYKGHIAGGVVVTGVYTGAVSFLPIERFAESANLLQDWEVAAAVFAVGILFALLPDVDTNSKAQDIFFWLAFLLNVALLWGGNIQASAYLGLICMLPIITHHRGWTHSKWAMFAVPLPIVLIPLLYNSELLKIGIVFYFAALAGYFSHLLLDGLIIRRFRIKN